MSKVHIAKQGFITKSALPSVSRTFPAYSQLLLLGNGTNGQTTFTDSSVNNYSITRTGDTIISTAQFPTGMTSSILFDGNADYLTTTPSNWFNPNDFTQFTMETYFFSPSTVSATQAMMGSWNEASSGSIKSISMGVYATNNIYCELYIANAYYSIVTTANNVFNINTWNHLALVKNGNTYTLYLNGTSRATLTQAGALRNSPSNFTIGGYNYNATNKQWFNGYLSNLRITLGTAIYTNNFTPPNLPLSNTPEIITSSSILLLGSGSNGSTTFTDSSINNFTMTRYGNTVISTAQFPTGMSSSIYIASSGDSVQTGPNATFAFGTSDGTIECYFYPLSFNNGLIWSMRNTGSGIYDNAVRITTSGYLGWSDGAQFNDATTGQLSLNTWTHVAWTKSGSNIFLWVNGNQVLTRSSYNPSTTSRYCSVGAFENGQAGTSVNGYISNFRSTKGIAVYTSNFTPPALPLANFIGTPVQITVTNNTYGVYQNY